MAELVPINSYHEYCEPYILEQYKGSRRLRALIDACLAQCDDIETAWFEIRAALNLHEAVGPALDYIGALIGVSRDLGQTDEAYLLRILQGNYSEDLPSMESLRNVLRTIFEQNEIGLYPCWPAGLYFILYGHTEQFSPSNLSDYCPSGVDIAQGTLFCLEDGEAYGLLVLEDNGQPLVIDQRWPDTEYELVDDEGNYLVDENGDHLVVIDF